MLFKTPLPASLPYIKYFKYISKKLKVLLDKGQEVDYNVIVGEIFVQLGYKKNLFFIRRNHP